ncbi:MAG: ABC transporter permease [Candidatus Aminicenantes bacterium]|nr:MAG: ABC transporter permease [Candidatus Aminicenantes bacterium]
MIKSYIKSALRSLRKRKAFSLINLSGLAIGITACMLIGLWVRHELSYDRFLENNERVFRVALRFDLPDVHTTIPNTPAPFAKTLRDTYPEVRNAVRVLGPRAVAVNHETNSYLELQFLWADSGFFSMFPYPSIEGDVSLAEPDSLVITQSMGEKYFSGKNPVGLTIQAGEKLYRITGVIADVPDNTHLPFDFVASLVGMRQGEEISWSYNNVTTYVEVKDRGQAKSLETKLPQLVQDKIAPGYERALGKKLGPEEQAFYLQPIAGVHLGQGLPVKIGSRGSLNYVKLFSLLAFFILLLACINFINLTTARAAERAREVGLRKTIGASRRQLVFQFMGESVMMSLTAMPLAIGTVLLILPAFNQLSGKKLRILFSSSDLLVWLGLAVLVGLLSGVYPSLVLSRFEPSRVVKRMTASFGSGLLRKGLVVFQFVISISLIAGTLVVQRQLDYMQSKSLGFQKEHILVIKKANVLKEQQGAFKQEILRESDILSASGSYSLPGSFFVSSLYRPFGSTADMDRQLNYTWVDEDFVETLGIEILEGRDFSSEYTTDEYAVLLNQKAVDAFGWDDPVGKRLAQGSGQNVWTVVGVMKDFHFKSLHQEIRPLALFFRPNQQFVSVQIQSENIPQVLAILKGTWKEFAPSMPFTYSFLDEDFDALYRSEVRLKQLFYAFTFVAIFIACLGLLGLAAFTAERRTKEIGIRKVLGAPMTGIVILLVKDFLKWIGIASAVALPCAYFLMQGWLQNFAYRVSIGIDIFVIAGTLTILIAIATVSFHSVRTALIDPIKNLHDE